MSTINEEERAEILEKALIAMQNRDHEEIHRLVQRLPLTPHVAMIAKDVLGKDFLIENGYNLSAAETTYGKDWLEQ